MSNYESRKGEGYVMIDHRASPGLPEDVARRAGYDPSQCGEGKLFETKSLTCSHCKSSVIRNPLRQRERNRCAKCAGHYICDICAFKASLPDYDHEPYEKKVERAIKEQMAAATPLTLILPHQIKGG